MIPVICIVAALVVGLLLASWARKWSRKTAAKLIYGSEHVHGAWCHPSADGCPDRPGM